MSKLPVKNIRIVGEEGNKILSENTETNDNIKNNIDVINAEYDIFSGDEGNIRIIGLVGTILFGIIFFSMFLGGIFYFEYLHHYMGYVMIMSIMWVSAILIIVSISMFLT